MSSCWQSASAVEEEADATSWISGGFPPILTLTNCALSSIAAIAIALPVIGGLFISQLTQESIVTWYRRLRKPFWNPPAIVFGPVWTVLYSLLGVASYQIWKSGGGAAQQWALKLYVVQLALNFLWPLVFFNSHNLALSCLVNLSLLATSLATQGAFYRILPEAGQLLLPYIVWLSFANVLNITVWRMNRHSGDVRSPDAPSSVADSKVQTRAKPVDEKHGPTGPATACMAPCLKASKRFSPPHREIARRLAAPSNLQSRLQGARRPLVAPLRAMRATGVSTAPPRMFC